MKLVDGHTGLESLGRAECLRLLAGEEVGRVGVVVAGEPYVFPVNFVLDGDAVVFRTGPGSKLQGATGRSVTFEVDHTDRATQSGWSVIVRGLAQEITAYDRVDIQRRLWNLPLVPWAEGDRSHVIRIPGTSVSGRRIPPRS